jgi:hypothetical protein
VDSNPQPDSFSGPVRDGEALDGGQQVEGHRSNLAGVLRTVGNGQAGDDHVRVANGLNLLIRFFEEDFSLGLKACFNGA